MKNLLAPPSPACLQSQEDVFRAVLRAVPVPASRAKDLPFAVRDLSRLLTREREALRTPYWAAPRFLAAYAHFFLPWNIHRLSWLLPELDLPLADDSRILDLGSGPLTLPLALWCARPDLRGKRLHFVCTDTAQSPLDAGKRIFAELGLPGTWRLECRRANLDAALDGSGFALVMAGNVLNELPPPRHGTEDRRIAGLIGRMIRCLAPQGRIFAVEPGGRNGGRTIALARKTALESGCAVLAPCTHENPCPMLEQNRYTPDRPASPGWCHFTHPPRLAPAHLLDLSGKAKMEKDGLSLSCLLLQAPEHRSEVSGGVEDLDDLEALYLETMAEDADHEPAQTDSGRSVFPPVPGPQPLRVISGLIRLPDDPEAARYACGPSGLCLLRDAVRVPSGAGVEAKPEPDFFRDAKTGALFVRGNAPKPAAAPTPPSGNRSEPRRAPGSRPDGKPTPKPTPRKPAAQAPRDEGKHPPRKPGKPSSRGADGPRRPRGK